MDEDAAILITEKKHQISIPTLIHLVSAPMIK